MAYHAGGEAIWPILRQVPRTFTQIGAFRALGIGVALWVSGFFVLMLGGPLAIVWLLFMMAAAAAGLLAIVWSWRANTWPVAVVIPLAVMLVCISALGVLAPFAM